MLRYTEICENWVSKVAKYRGCRGRARQMRYQMEPLVPAVQCSGVRTLFCEGGVEGGSSQSTLRYTEICENWVSKVAKYRGCRGHARQMRYQMEPLVPAVQCSGVRTLFCEGGVEGGSSQSMLRYTEICENWVSKVAKYRGCRGRARQMRYQMEPLVPAVQCSGVRTLFCEGGVEGGSSQSTLRYTEICENWVSKVAKYRGCRGRARQMRYQMEPLVPAVQCSGVRPLFCEGG